jgi:hypothetical protein
MSCMCVCMGGLSEGWLLLPAKPCVKPLSWRPTTWSLGLERLASRYTIQAARIFPNGVRRVAYQTWTFAKQRLPMPPMPLLASSLWEQSVGQSWWFQGISATHVQLIVRNQHGSFARNFKVGVDGSTPPPNRKGVTRCIIPPVGSNNWSERAWIVRIVVGLLRVLEKFMMDHSVFRDASSWPSWPTLATSCLSMMFSLRLPNVRCLQGASGPQSASDHGETPPVILSMFKILVDSARAEFKCRNPILKLYPFGEAKSAAIRTVWVL